MLQPKRVVQSSRVKPAPTPAPTGPAPAPGRLALNAQTEYWTDFAQRSVLFLDILRERANNMLAHEATGLPPLLHCESEMVLDARTFAHPVNYALLRIIACETAPVCCTNMPPSPPATTTLVSTAANRPSGETTT